MTDHGYTPDELFHSCAPYYAKYRPGYPPGMFAHLVDRFALDGTQRILDLGCGTGQIAVPISAHAAEVIAVDPEPAMLAEGRRAASAAGAGNITWLQGSSETLEQLDLGTVDLVCIGAAFHWMHRENTLTALDRIITAHGGIVIASGPHPDDYRPPPWQETIDRVRTAWLGPERRAGSGSYTHPAERHEQVFARSAFTDIDTRTWEQTVERDIDDAIGLQFSYSFNAPQFFGDRQDAYAAELRHALETAHPSGDFTETVTTEALIAIRH